MVGKEAKKVKLDMTFIRREEVSGDIFIDWSKRMKEAIWIDLIAEECRIDQMLMKGDLRYVWACEEFMTELIFELKWRTIKFSDNQDEYENKD